MAPEPDFTGYATRNGLKCTDGRVIMGGAFKGNDGQRVPLVWQHGHNDPTNVLGHAVLTNVSEGVRAAGYFNETPNGQNAKMLVRHGDIKALSIYANELIQKGSNVHHGNIREVSLVLSGANPGAVIDNVAIKHGGDEFPLDDEAIISTGDEIELEHAAAPSKAKAKTDASASTSDSASDDSSDETVADVFNSLTDIQKNAVYAMLAAVAAQNSAAHSDTSGEDTEIGGIVKLAHAAAGAGEKSVEDVLSEMTEEQQAVVHGLIGQALSHSGNDNTEGTVVSRNVFDQTDDGPAGGASTKTTPKHTLSHSDVREIVQNAQKRNGGSLKEAVQEYALAHGIDDIDTLFPDAKLLQDQPDFISRRTEWVATVLGATRHSPFSRVKTILADITQEEARAKGYIKGNLKSEEFFGVTKRTTTPTTVYKKQKLDRDDVLDITDFDVVAWIKGEMRLMLDEEVARAILIGDGRDISDLDKVKDPVGASDGAGIRSILNDHEIYVTTVNVNLADASSSPDEIVDAIVAGMTFYRGTGVPTFFTTLPILTKLLLAKDSLGRRLYATQAELASAMMVSNIVTVEPMEELEDCVGIVVNLQDYNVGADNGGDVSMFDFFDIDFNQQKYLIETRLSGALVKYKSAVVINNVNNASDVLIDPVVAPTVDGNVVSGLNQTNVTYAVTDANGSAVTVTSGSFTMTSGTASPVTVVASPASGYYFASNAKNTWVFSYTPSS